MDYIGKMVFFFPVRTDNIKMSTHNQCRFVELLNSIYANEIGLWNAIRIQEVLRKHVQTVPIPNQMGTKELSDEAKSIIKMFSYIDNTLMEYERILWELIETKSKLKGQLEHLYLGRSYQKEAIDEETPSNHNQPIKNEPSIKVPREESSDRMDLDNINNDIADEMEDEETLCDAEHDESAREADEIIQSLKSDRRTSSKNNEFICNECSTVFRYKSKLLKHLLDHSSPKPFECALCDRKFAAKRLLRAHMQLHSSEKFSCPHCPKVFNTKNAFSKHIRVKHIDVKIFSCAMCSRQFDQRTKLNSHMRFHTGEKSYQCSECNERFGTSTQRTSHIRKMHTGERPFACNVCTKRFMLKCQLNQHMFSHSDVRDSHCDKCESSFKTVNELKRHQIVHMEERPFACNQCSMSFKRVDSLAKHNLTHTGERTYTCELCGAQFSTFGNLNLHRQRRHTEERRHPCSVCNKRFPTNAEMKKHMTIHTRQIKCNVCGKQFKKDEHRRNHMKVHSGEFVHVCSECDRGFSNRKNMLRHIRLNHDGKSGR